MPNKQPRKKSAPHFELNVTAWLDWCMDNGWDSDEAVAKALGLNPVTVWRIQNGHSAPGTSVLAAVWNTAGLKTFAKIFQPAGQHSAPTRIAA